MSDRSAAEIRIGGDVDCEQMMGLYTAAENDNAAFEWGEPPEHDAEAFFALPAEPLVLRNSEVSGGTLDELEEFCRANGLTFVRQTSAHYAYDAELSWWKPGMEGAVCCATNERGESLLRAEEIDKIMREGRSAAEIIGNLRKFLDENTPPEVPPLRLVAAVKG